MNLPRSHSSPRRAASRQQGVAIIIVLAVLAVLTMLMTLNSRTLARVKQEILLLEKQHQQRWQNNPAPEVAPRPTQPTPATP